MTLLSPSSLKGEINRLISLESYNPHGLLGLHSINQNEKVIRLWRPGAQTVYIELQGKIVQMQQVDPAGLFELYVPFSINPTDYRVYHQNGLLAHDPYAFWPTLGEWDQYIFGQGTHYKLYNALGGRISVQQGVTGCKFAVWAPSAKSVSLVADFNYWNGQANPMRSLGQSGIWELFVPGIEEGTKYKFEIQSQSGQYKIKADPFALSSELRPSTASVISNVSKFHFEDQEWIQRREKERHNPKPLNIYEVHLGSWRKKEDNSWYNYSELADMLIPYVKEYGYNYSFQKE